MINLILLIKLINQVIIKVIWIILMLIISGGFLIHAMRGFDIIAVYYIQSDVINVKKISS